MYKRVTHTITEEHFGHPMATEIKHTLENKFDTERPRLDATTADKFRNDVNSYFTGLHTKLANIATATETGNMEALIAAETVYFDEVEQIGKLMQPYYGIEFSERINQVFRGTGLSTIGISRNLKFKSDIKILVERLLANFDNLDFLLNQFNNVWVGGSVKSTWVPIIDSIVAEMSAIMNRDSSGTVAEHTKGSNLISAFSNTLANSVIQQYPTRFIL